MATLVRLHELWHVIADHIVTLHRISASSFLWQLLAAIIGWGLQLVATRTYYTCSDTESWDEEKFIWYNDIRYLAQFSGPIFFMIVEYEARPFFPQVAKAFPRWGWKTAAETQAPAVDDTDDCHREGIELHNENILADAEAHSDLEGRVNEQEQKDSAGVNDLWKALMALKDSEKENETLRKQEAALKARMSGLKMRNDVLQNQSAELRTQLGETRKDLGTENESLRNQQAETTRNINILTEKIQNQLAEVNDQRKRAEDLEVKNDVLQSKMYGIAKHINELEEEKDELQERAVEQGEELRISEERINSLQAKLVRNRGDHTQELFEGEKRLNNTPKAPIPIKRWAPVSLMARFKGFTPAEKELTKLDWDLDKNRGIITAPASLRNLPGSLPTHAENQYSGFMSILGFEANNDAVWQSLSPAFEAFTGGRPLCVLFDGYSGSGKTHTMFEGSTAVFPSVATELFNFIDSLGKGVKTSLQLHACAIDFDPIGGGMIGGAFTKKTYTEHRRWLTDTNDATIIDKNTLIQTVEAARQQRDKGHVRKTAQNTKSSRSHLVLKLIMQVGGPIPYATSLCLVDLVGAEVEGDIHPEEKNKEVVKLEQEAIRKSRGILHSCLAQAEPRSLLNTGKLMPQLKEYFSQQAVNQKQLEQRLHPVQPPLCIHFSMLNALEREASNTIRTLAFSQELLKAGGSGGGGRRPQRVSRPASAEPSMPRPHSAGEVVRPL